MVENEKSKDLEVKDGVYHCAYLPQSPLHPLYKESGFMKLGSSSLLTELSPYPAFFVVPSLSSSFRSLLFPAAPGSGSNSNDANSRKVAATDNQIRENTEEDAESHRLSS